MIEAIAVLGGISGFAALGLGIASIKFHVEIDPRVEAVEGLLPGANCGGCGFAGCSALAKAIVEGSALPNACPPGGADAAKAIAGVMGVDAGASLKRVAAVHCKGGKSVAGEKGVYQGVEDCRAAAIVGGGPKLCAFGCMGFGTCRASCPFDAIEMTADGLPLVDMEKCTGCGNCVEVCPKNIIDLMPENKLVYIRCKNPHKGKAVTSVCSVACIGCAKCEKTCPFGAISMDQNLAVMDKEKCTSCGLCAPVCPTGNIDDLVVVRFRAKVIEDACIGCAKCIKVCPTEAVSGERKKPHVVETAKCISCYKCIEVCPVNALEKAEPYGRQVKGRAA